MALLESTTEVLEQKFQKIIQMRKKMEMGITESKIIIIIDCQKIPWKELQRIGHSFADFINCKFKRFPKNTDFFLTSKRYEIDKNDDPKDKERQWKGIRVFYSPLANDKKWFGFDFGNEVASGIKAAELRRRAFKWKEL